MKITKKKYENAKKTVEAAKESLKIVKTWEEATKDMTGVEAITVEGEKIRYEIVKETKHTHG